MSTSDDAGGERDPQTGNGAVAPSAPERIAELSRHFLTLESGEIEAAIREHLAEAAELAGAQRTSLIAIAPGPPVALGHYDWSAPGVARDYARPDPEAGPGRRFRWAAGRLLRGEVVEVRAVDELSGEAAAEREDLARRGVRSFLAIPVRYGDLLAGCQTFETLDFPRSWSVEEIAQLGLVGGIFAAALRRKRTEDALRESEERFSAIAEHATEVVAELDHTGVYRYVSRSYQNVLGYAPDELVGRNSGELIHPEDLERLTLEFFRSSGAMGAFHGAYRMRHRDGSWRWMENSGRGFHTASGEMRFLSLGRDITERKALDDAIARQLEVEQRVVALSRRFLPLSADEIDDAIRDALAETADVAEADRCYLLSFTLDAARKMPFYEWLAEGIPSHPLAPATPWSRGKASRGEILQVTRPSDLPPEARLERENLESRGVISLLGIPVFSGEEPAGYLAFETMRREKRWSEQDVTLLRLAGELFTSALRRKRTEEALRESREQLLQSQKLEAVGRLAGGIAHDFNNLLTVILGFSRALMRDLEEDHVFHEDLSEIHGAAERAAGLTRQLLTFGRRQLVVSERVDMNATIAGLEQLLGRVLGEDIELVVELAADSAWVRGDANQLEQVVVNVAVNARDAMPEGGTLRIGIDERFLDATAAGGVGLARGGRYVVLSVDDSGAGMDEETRAHIFEPFFTTKEPGKGSGLGLSIVYSVVEQAGGAVSVESEPGKGTRLEIFLPRAQAAGSARPPREGAYPGGRGESVLLVEDEPAVRRLARRILSDNGYRVLEAEDGMRALELAESHPEPVDLLLTDLVMPRMGGGDLARRLRAERPDLRVVYISGYPDSRDGDRGTPVPEGGFVQKPFSISGLLGVLREALDR